MGFEPKLMYEFLCSFIDVAKDLSNAEKQEILSIGAEVANHLVKHGNYSDWGAFIRGLSDEEKEAQATEVLNWANKAREEDSSAALGYRIVAINIMASALNAPLAATCEELSGEFLLAGGLKLEL